MPEPTVDRIDEFPKDGRLWWVRWVDRYHVPKGGTATPGVEVLLSPLDISLRDLRNANPQEIAAARNPAHGLAPVRIPVFTGFLPRLPLGLVFLDGVEVANIPLESARFDIHEFSVAVRDTQDELSNKPAWRKYPYRVINRGDYYLGDFPDARKSKAVVVESSDAVIVIPCHEIFRTMYAPHSDIAWALTAGPWEFTKTNVVAPDGTGLRDDGRWQVTLRRRIKDDFGPTLANLCNADIGKAAANGIYAGLLQNDGPGFLTAPFPFSLGRLTFQARGLWLDGEPKKFLVLQLLSMDWPSSPELVTFRDNCAKKGEIQTPIEKDRPFASPSAITHADEDGIVDANSQEDPSASSAVTTFVVPAIEWRNIPKQVKEAKKESFIYRGRPRSEAEREFERASPGTEWMGDTDSGSGAYSSESSGRRDVSQRFEEVMKLFDRLHSTGRVESWSIIPHPRPLLHMDEVPLWHFPVRAKDTKQFLAFSYLHRKEQQRRGALLCELRLNRKTIYWLEIEVRSGEPGRKALLYTVSEQGLIPATNLLLESAARNRGVWPQTDELAQFPGVWTAATWRHTYVNKPKKGKGGRLNENRALATLADVAGVELIGGSEALSKERRASESE
ncbi:hypothetical protein MX652_13725 [Thauera aromatica]|nr:hypothetical protein [Thauera aromatica]MCK2127746.1 hypothetical protein [Thauera aromatica]